MNKFTTWLSSQPIRNKVLAFGILMSSIPLFLLSFYYFIHSKNDLENRIKEKQELMLKNLTTEIELQFNQTFSQLQTVSANHHDGQDEQKYYEVLQQNESVEEVVLTDEKGEVEKRVSRFKLNIPLKNEKWFSKEMLKSFQRHEKIYGSVELNSLGQPTVKLAVPYLEGGKRKAVGVVVQLQRLMGEISSLRSDNSSYIYLLDQNENIIAHGNFNRSLKGNGSDGSVLGVRQKIMGLNWTIVMEQPKTIAYKPIYRMFQEGILVVVIFTLIVSLISIYAGLFFTKPIIKLDHAMKRLKDGEKLEALSANSSDEIGKLVTSFNEMSQELQDKSRRLEQEKEHLNVVLDGIGAGLALVTRNYEITWMNPLLKSLVKEDYFHLPCYQLISGRSGPCEDCILTDASITGNVDKFITFKDISGRERIFRHRIFPLTHVIDGEAEYLLFIEDVTEQKEIEEKMVQTDKLAALGLLASSFAHEVNNPLTTINVFAEDLIDRFDSQDSGLDRNEINYYLGKIRENTERCKRITGNLLNFSRKSNWSISFIDLRETINNTLSLVDFSLKKKKVKLSVDLVDPPDKFLGDSLKLMQVLVNLIQNAIDAIEEEGFINIFAKMENEQLFIRVSDTGTGISNDILPNIFDPFYTTKPVGKGTGLGLSVCYGIIQQFGGTIEIASELNKGTDVDIQIPIRKKIEAGA